MTRVSIRCQALTDLGSALVGFQIHDDRGQLIVGVNTNHAYRNRPMRVAAGQEFDVTFDLKMPHLRSGAYHLAAAIADGTQLNKVHHQWMNDVISLTVVSSQTIRGVTGVPMRSIQVVRSGQETAPAV
jgi:lipopolysaccharide transport system ATP-binding protein